jgi:hypothetical protein
LRVKLTSDSTVTNENRARSTMALSGCLSWFTKLVVPFLFSTSDKAKSHARRRTEHIKNISLQLSCSVCISVWGANKHSCLNKVVGTMPGPIGLAGGIGVGGIALHIQFASLFLSARCCCLAVYLSSAPPTFSPQTPPRYTSA